MIRFRDRNPDTKIINYDVKPLFTGRKKGWSCIDSFTAGAIMAVYNAIQPELQARFDVIPLPRLLKFVWENVR